MIQGFPDVRTRLPVFPLPTVLLPGTQMPLHIFEPRYQDMVRDVLEGDRRFGLVYHDWDLQGPFLCEEGTVGCTAEISQHEALEDGRSLIIVDGGARFAIVDGIESASRYFDALVHPYAEPIEGAPSPARRPRASDRDEAVLHTLSDRPPDLPSLSTDRDVSFLLAQTIRVDPRWHQELLEMTREEERLVRIDTVLRALL